MTVTRFVLPQTLFGRFLWALNLGMLAAAYLSRSQLLDPNHDLSLLRFPILHGTFLILLVLSGLFFLLSVTPFRDGGGALDPAPLLWLVGGIIAVHLLPLPLWPEERAFIAHRVDYERIVELAQQHQLEHDDQCVSNIAFAPPSEYRHFLSENCVFVERTQGVVVVSIAPFWFYEQLVYVETPEAIESSLSCREDGFVVKRLNEHWYICTVDWM